MGRRGPVAEKWIQVIGTRILRLHIKDYAAQPADPAQPPAKAAPSDLQPPALERRVEATYPEEAKQQRLEASVGLELVVGERFDRVMTRSPKQARATDEYHSARDELARLRDESFERARAVRRPRRGPRVRVYE